MTARARPVAILVTCEHGGNDVPSRYRSLFARHAAALASHRGHDIGSLTVARDLARSHDAHLIAATTTRLLVDLNRSIGHPRLFSTVSRRLATQERERILDEQYRPYRIAVEALVRSLVTTGHRVVHVSSHSFTARLNGTVRDADIGLLYDPARQWERTICSRWQDAFEQTAPDLRVRRNYPYRGTADGLTTALRRLFPTADYAGIELEINQRYPLGDAAAWRRLRRHITKTLADSID
ncbi:MAG TPA: N-formylglutamate amidohydrolase [Steroidobacteraceae bacterium]|nr:N-formylglutamate amidohydrolase [Steroidobacteraceae bacterium]